MLFEYKDARRSYTLKLDDLRALMTRAIRQDRMGVMVVRFSGSGLCAEIRLVPVPEA